MISLERLLDFTNWPSTVPSPLAEAGNGIVIPVLLLVLLGLAAYVVAYWLWERDEGEPLLARRPLAITYYERKAALALFLGVTGFEMKTAAVWLVRHLENHGVAAREVLPRAFAPVVFIAGTVLIVVGFTCWLRVTVPQPIRRWTVRVAGKDRRVGRLAWPLAMVACIAWGVWMAT